MVPGAGPQWFGSVMGTGILSNLTQTLAGDTAAGRGIALVLLVIAWALMVGLAVGFAARVARRPSVFHDTRRTIGVLVTWGMVAMGVLSVGSATAAVVPAHWPDLSGAAWAVDAVLWCCGTALGVTTSVGFALRLISRDLGAPTTTWGLPLVPPMVSSTTGAALVPHVGGAVGRVCLLMASVGCFLLALTLGVIVFIVAYHHHWFVRRLAIDASASSWIPLGIVGQSTAAAQVVAAQAKTMALPDYQTAIQSVADWYGYAMAIIGAPLIAWAAAMTARGLRRSMAFAPGWWALTFPVGTLCLGSHFLHVGTGADFWGWAAFGFLALLAAHWCLCAAATCRAVVGRVRA